MVRHAKNIFKYLGTFIFVGCVIFWYLLYTTWKSASVSGLALYSFDKSYLDYYVNNCLFLILLFSGISWICAWLITKRLKSVGKEVINNNYKDILYHV